MNEQARVSGVGKGDKRRIASPLDLKMIFLSAIVFFASIPALNKQRTQLRYKQREQAK